MSKVDLKIKRTKGENEFGKQVWPTFYLNDVNLPVGKKDVGKTMMVKLKVKLTGYGENNSTKADHKSFDFAMQTIEFVDGAVEEVKKAIKGNE